MGKSESGPDMRSCATYLTEMERSQNCSTTILLDVAGFSVGAHWLLHILSVKVGSVESPDQWSVATAMRWPNRENKTFEGALFRALAEHDAAISQAAFQELLGLT